MLITLQHAVSRLGDLFTAGCVAAWIGVWLSYRIRPLVGLVFITTFAAAVLSCFAFKLLAGIYAPPLEEAGRIVMSQGAPSGHVVCAMVAYGGLALILMRLLKGPIAFLGAAGSFFAVVGVAMTRFTLRTHTLGDVLAGLALGLIFLLLFDMALRKWRRPENAHALPLLAGAALVAVLAVVSGLSLSSSHVL
jgi:membrane-associated phospholipid phosphatase